MKKSAEFKGADLRKKRKALGITQSRIAAYIGISESQVSRWESKNVTIPEMHQESIKQLLEETQTNAGSGAAGATARKNTGLRRPVHLQRTGGLISFEEFIGDREKLAKAISQVIHEPMQGCMLLVDQALGQGPPTMRASNLLAIAGLCYVAAKSGLDAPSPGEVVELPLEGGPPPHVHILSPSPDRSRAPGKTTLPVGVSEYTLEMLTTALAAYSQELHRGISMYPGYEGPNHERASLILISRLLSALVGGTAGPANE